ncbi:MAG: hypothetical protein WA771_12900 [Chthoniobacterales bacterium]
MTHPSGDTAQFSFGKWTRRLATAVLLSLTSVSVSGCLYDVPLTIEASTNIDTRLLGVFEYEETVLPPADAPPLGPDDEAEIVIHRAAVIPRGPDTYWIFYRNFGQTPAKTLRFIGWISRVDDVDYLTLMDDTEGSDKIGKFSFVKFDWNFPGNFSISSPNMQGLESGVTPMEMREGVRARLAEGTLFPYQPTPWKKIARVYLDKNAEDAALTIPKEFELGTEREQPGL